MEYIKGNEGNAFLVVITIILFIILGYSEYKYQSWKRPDWFVIGKANNRHIYIKECTAYIRDDMYLKSGTLYEEEGGKLRHKKKYFITPKTNSVTLLNSEKYKFPFQIDIHWTSIEESQAWYTSIVLPKEYQGVGKTYKILLDFTKDGVIHVYIEDENSNKLIGTYNSEPQDWWDIVNLGENVDKEIQTAYVSSIYKWRLEIDQEHTETKTNSCSIYFHSGYPSIYVNIEANKKKPKVIETLPWGIDIDRNKKYILPDKIELVKSLRKINEIEPGSVSLLKLTIFSPDSVVINLISESGNIHYPIPVK